MLNFEMGGYTGYKGQKKPCIELTHPSGSIVRFWPYSNSWNVNTVHIPADPTKTGYAVQSVDRGMSDANALYRACIAKGFVVTANDAGESA